MTIGATDFDFSACISSAQFTPSSSNVTWKGMVPNDTFTAPTSPTWVLALALVDDLATTSSLTNQLLAHQGETAPAKFYPLSGGPGWSADVILTPAGLGGAVDTYGSQTVSLGVQGGPSPIAAPAS
jgi:hypothetical protein